MASRSQLRLLSQPIAVVGGDGGALQRPSERWVEVWEAANIANTTVHCITDLAVKLISSEE